jgi:hypothetical protein
MDTGDTINKIVSILIESLTLLRKADSKKYKAKNDYRNVSPFKEEEKMIFLKYSLTTLLHNLNKYAFVEKSSLVSSLIFVDRLIIRSKSIVNLDNIYFWLIGCVFLSTKMNQDYYRTGVFSHISKISVEDLCDLEYQLLNEFNYQCYICPRLYDSYSQNLNRLSI